MPAHRNAGLLCPACGHRTTPGPGPGGGYVCRRAGCGAELEPSYVEEALPQTVIACVGFTGHGKTLLLTSLLGSLVDGRKHNLGQGALVETINPTAFNVVVQLWQALEKGNMPPPTGRAFQTPGICRVQGIDDIPPRNLIFFDVAGGVFDKWDPNATEPGIVSMFGLADVLWVICSALDPQVKPQLQLLMQAYVNHTTSRPGGAALLRRKRVVVTYTKADRLLSAFEKLGYADVANYLVDDPAPVDREYKHVLKYISGRLADFTCKYVPGGPGFHAMCSGRFHSLDYAVVSALGCETDGHNRLTQAVNPRRIVDPLVLSLEG